MRVLLSHRVYGLVVGVLLAVLVVEILVAQQPSLRFGGAYSELDERRRLPVRVWMPVRSTTRSSASPQRRHSTR
jgi:hypothetical protein